MVTEVDMGLPLWLLTGLYSNAPRYPHSITEHLPDIQLLPKSDSGDLLGHRLSICAGNRGTNWPRRDTHESEKRFC